MMPADFEASARLFRLCLKPLPAAQRMPDVVAVPVSLRRGD
jgi:hypothetical protein